jgi:hypothetical protein
MKLFKNLVFCCLFLTFSQSVIAQTDFKSGYFINNDGEKVSCLILEEKWKNNPTTFFYKLDKSGDIQTGNLKDIKAFGVDSLFKFVRKDKFLPRETLDQPVFLNVLLEGKVSVYHYRSKSANVFFYKKDGEKTIYELQYRYSARRVGDAVTQNKFRGQLYEAFGSNKLDLEKIKNVKYNRNDILNIVSEYNTDTNVIYSKFYKASKEKVNMYFKVGAGSTPIVIDNTSIGEFPSFGNDTGLRIGFEMEYFIPNTSEKWAVTASPMVKFISAERENISSEGEEFTDTFDYAAIEMQFGGRYYFNSAESKTRLYANAGFFVEIPVNSTMNFLGKDSDVGIGSILNAYVGVGFQYQRFGIEFSYLPYTYLIETSNEFSAEFDTVAFQLTYSLFKN